jgi:hypothetical protein
MCPVLYTRMYAGPFFSAHQCVNVELKSGSYLSYRGEAEANALGSVFLAPAKPYWEEAGLDTWLSSCETCA